MWRKKNLWVGCDYVISIMRYWEVGVVIGNI